MKYSFNADRKDVVLAGEADINASHKDLCAVADAIRYKSVPNALEILDGVIENGHPVYFRTNNKGMGSRHELGGRKGRYPEKCARIMRKVLIKAVSAAKNKGLGEDTLFVVHATANKTVIIRRSPSKGVMSFGRGMYGYGSPRRSNIEFAKVEIGLSEDASMLSESAAKRVEKEKTRLAALAAKKESGKNPAAAKAKKQQIPAAQKGKAQNPPTEAKAQAPQNK